MGILTKTKQNAIALTLAVMAAGSASAADLITARMTVTPADGSVGQMFGQVMIHWEDTELQMDDRTPGAKNYLDLSLVSLTLNDEEITLNNTLSGGSAYVSYLESSDEQMGGGTYGIGDFLFITFPDAFPNPYFTWTGTVNLELKEGLVTTTDGEVNGPVSLTYYFQQAATDIAWVPQQNTTFLAGECFINASWGESDELRINENVSKAPFIQKEDASNDDKFGDQISVADKMSIVDGTLQFDLSDLTAGTYSLTLTEGAVFVGDDYINGEAYYNFRVIEGDSPETPEVPDAVVKVLPDENDWFDGFSVLWGSMWEPYSLSSKYTEYNEDSESYIFTSEGLALISVKENDEKEVKILQASLVEYQFNQTSENYPSGQLNITLQDFQTNVGSTYTLTLSPGLVEIDVDGTNVANDEVTYSFTLGEGSKFTLPEPTVSPQSGEVVEYLNSISIYWDSSDEAGYDLLNLNTASAPVTVTCDAEPFESFSIKLTWSDPEAVTEGAQGDIFTINFENAPAGEYEITIPEGYVNVTDISGGTQPSQEISLSYTVTVGEEEPGSGVSAIEGVAGGVIKVYNLQGMKVAEATDATEINHLPKGVYIVNGKKIAIK